MASRGWLVRAAVLGAVTMVVLSGLVPATARGLVAGNGDGDGTGDEVPVVVTLFYLEGCPHCHDERQFLDDLMAELDGVVVEAFEISGNEANQRLFSQTAARMGFEARAVPTTIIGDDYWVGFSDAVGAQITAVIESRLALAEAAENDGSAGPKTSTEATEAVGADSSDEAVGANRAVVDVPGVGDVDLSDRSLLLSTLLIGFVDGFNPCSLWVLSLLLALVLHSGSRTRVLAVGAVFLTITTGLYGLYIVGIYSIVSYVSYLTWIQRGVAVVAATFGVINIKDYFWYRRGPSLSIGERHKPGLYRGMRGLARPDQGLAAVLTGTAALAVGVSLVETPCTAGFPIIWADLLSAHNVGFAAAAVLFGVYMLVFLVDELAIFAAAVVTMRVTKLEEDHGRLLKLFAGVVMLALAITMLVDADRLSTVSGTVVVFGSAALVAALIALAQRQLVRVRS